MGMASACNSKSDQPEEIVVTPSTTAVKAFTLKANSAVLSNLDSVFFSIDLDNGVIFNADSLPKGTNITKLIPVITFANSMSEVKIEMEGGSEKTGTVDYLESPNDTIDFSGKVTLNVTAADGINKYSYRIKVNVHKEVPDSMMWDKLGVSDLPSRLKGAVAQKTVIRDKKVFTLIEESDASFTLASTSNIGEGSWSKESVTIPFPPEIESLTATSEAFWMLDSDGNLYTSADAKTWSATGERWITLVGSYLDRVIGVKDAGGHLTHCHYPASDMIADTPVDPDFPLYQRSELRSIENPYTPYPTAIFAGGVTASGNVSSDVWAFDGSSWATINNAGIPALKGATLVKYVHYRNTNKVFVKKQYDAWLIIGGSLADGSFNSSLFISLNNGVNWQKGSSAMQLPDYFPHLTGADGIVADSYLKADLSDAWKRMPSRSAGRWMKPSYSVDGDNITWECPYIYFLGGTLPDGTMSSEIWRGVLARLTFTPII